MKRNNSNPILLGGFGTKNSNGGKQYYQQDRVYFSSTEKYRIISTNY